MKGSTFFGILLGVVAIFGAFFWEGGSFSTLFLLPAMLIVLGGTLAAGLAGSSFEMISRLPILFVIVVSSKVHDWKEILDQIVKFASISRHEGILSLDEKLKNLQHPFMRKLFQVMVDGSDPTTLNHIAEVEIQNLTDRHMENIVFFNKLGGYSPTMGIIGTVMGLISTFAAAGSDPNILIQHIASAFIATLWGIFMANIVWLPIADKLRYLHDREVKLMNFIINGVQGVQSGETPTVILTRLAAAFPIGQQTEILKRRDFYRKEELAYINKEAVNRDAHNREIQNKEIQNREIQNQNIITKNIVQKPA
jgi:chemotaxis protein MotA